MMDEHNAGPGPPAITGAVPGGCSGQANPKAIGCYHTAGLSLG